MIHPAFFSVIFSLIAVTLSQAATTPTVSVNTLSDEDDGDLNSNNGNGTSLREAINHSSPGATITFDSSLNGGTIILTEGQLSISQNLTIDASTLSRGITIDANGAVTNHRVIEIQANTIVTCSGLNLTRGSAQLGGAILMNGNGTGNSVQLTLNSCTLFNNSGDFGGGIFSNGQSGSVNLTLNSCTFSNNSIVFDGGAVFSDGGFGGNAILTLNSCTFSANSANNGGGIFSIADSGSASLILNNSILAGNTATGSGPDLWDSNPDSTTTTLGTNLISDLEGQDSLSISTANLIIAPPLLAPLGKHGGATMTMPPLPGSPAINAGSANTTDGTDQRGLTRLIDGFLDIGAVEIQEGEALSPFPNPFPFPVSEFSSDSDQDGTPNGLEVILGSNPFIADNEDPRKPIFFLDPDGQPSLTFGRGPDLPAGLTLSVVRSPLLTSGSFEILASYDSASNTITLPAGNTSAGFIMMADQFIFTDSSPRLPRNFYRLEATFDPS